jgi:hypothetical protein
MKNISIKIIGVFILVVLVLTSCKKWIDTDLNVNPDAPADVPMSSLLPSIEANMAFNTIGGNDIVRVTSMWLQYFSGVSRQSQAEADYIFRDGDVNNQWNTNYAFTMMDLKKLIGKATESENATYLGIGNVLLANALGICTDVWDAIPYSEAFQGQDNLSPKFDDQQAIYVEIITLLDGAIAALPNGEVVEGDLIYGGDPALWLKAARAMKARYQLHLSKQDGNAWANALASLDQSLAGNDEDMEFPFAVGVGSQSPLFQFMDQRGDITMHKTFIDILNIRFDPRVTVFATLSGDTTQPYKGADWGSGGEDASLPGPAYAAEDSPTPFITYAECLFIKAECEFKTGVAESQVRATLIQAVSASMDKWGVLNPLYIAAYDSVIQLYTGNVLYKEIMIQKYIALYHQAEAFNDWRRTENIIELFPNPLPTAVRNEIPRRFPYSTDEKNYNSNTPDVADIWVRVWWDPLPNN